MSSCDILSQESCTHCHNSEIAVVGSGERVSSRFLISYTCSIGERSGAFAGQGSCTPRRASYVAAAFVDVRCPTEKAHHLPVEEMAVARD